MSSLCPSPCLCALSLSVSQIINKFKKKKKELPAFHIPLILESMPLWLPHPPDPRFTRGVHAGSPEEHSALFASMGLQSTWAASGSTHDGDLIRLPPYSPLLKPLISTPNMLVSGGLASDLLFSRYTPGPRRGLSEPWLWLWSPWDPRW